MRALNPWRSVSQNWSKSGAHLADFEWSELQRMDYFGTRRLEPTTPEIIAEAANIPHKDLSGILATSHSQAFYAQSAYRLPLANKVWKPYYRYEYIHIPKLDLPFRGVSNLNGSVIGLRYDLSEFAALKFEYRHRRRAPDLLRVNSGFIQTSFTF